MKKKSSSKYFVKFNENIVRVCTLFINYFNDFFLNYTNNLYFSLKCWLRIKNAPLHAFLLNDKPINITISFTNTSPWIDKNSKLKRIELMTHHLRFYGSMNRLDAHAEQSCTIALFIQPSYSTMNHAKRDILTNFPLLLSIYTYEFGVIRHNVNSWWRIFKRRDLS